MKKPHESKGQTPFTEKSTDEKNNGGEKMIYWLVMLVILASSWGTEAFAQRATYQIGIGTYSCGQYLAHRKGDHESFTGTQTGIYVSWVWGYLSGYNYFSAHRAMEDLPDQNTVIAYLDKYCKDHPLTTVSAGTECLIADMGGSRPKYCKP